MANISYATYDVVEMSRAEDRENYDYQETADSQLQRSDEIKRSVIAKETM